MLQNSSRRNVRTAADLDLDILAEQVEVLPRGKGLRALRSEMARMQAYVQNLTEQLRSNL